MRSVDAALKRLYTLEGMYYLSVDKSNGFIE